jgi:hypothetical protein
VERIFGWLMSDQAGTGGGPGSSGPSIATRRVPALIGRDAELARLDSTIHAVRDGDFRAVLVLGAAGIGKSRLVSEASARHADNVSILSARAYRWGTTVSFGAWLEALDRELRRRPADEIEALCGSARSELASMLPSVAAATGPTERPPDRSRLIDALGAVLARSVHSGRPWWCWTTCTWPTPRRGRRCATSGGAWSPHR